jgi:hypothetical protein
VGFFGAGAREKVPELVLSKSMGIWNGTQYPDSQIPDAALADARNIIPGTWKQREGQKTKYLSAVVGVGAVKGLHSYQPHSGTPLVLYGIGGTLYHTNGTIIESGLTDNNFEFVTYLDTVYYVNGADSLRSTTGTTGAAVTPYTPAAGEEANYLADAAHAVHDSKYIAVHEHVIYLAAPASHPYRVYRSDETQGASYFRHYVDVVSRFGGKIVGLVPFRGSLIILKEDSIWSADGQVGDATFSLKQLHSSVGCASGRTAVDVPTLGLVFLGTDGHWYVLRPDLVNAENVPLYRLSTHFAGAADNLNKGYLSTSCGAIFNNMYWCSVPTGSSTTPDKTYVFDYTQVAPLAEDPTSLFVPWSIYTEPTASEYSVHFTGAVYQLLWASATTGMVYQAEEGTNDDGTAIDAWFELANFSLGASNRMKTALTKHILAKREVNETSLLSYVSVDDDSYSPLDSTGLQAETRTWGAGTWGDGTWGSQKSGYQSHKIYVNQRGQQFQVKFQQNTLDRSFDITEIRLRYRMGEVR